MTFMRTTDYNQWLLPYLEGTLDAAQAAEVKARLAADPALAAEAEHLRQTLDGLRGAASRAQAPMQALPPTDLWPRLHSRIATETPPRRAVSPRLWWTAGASLAAASLILIGVTQSPQMRHASLPAKPLVKAAPSSVSQPIMPPQIAEGPKPTPSVALPSESPAGSPTLPSAPHAKSSPITTADPFALPLPHEASSEVSNTAGLAGQSSPPGKLAAKNKTVQVASSGLNPRPEREIAPSYYSDTSSAAVTPMPLDTPASPMPPAPPAAPPLSGEARAFRSAVSSADTLAQAPRAGRTLTLKTQTPASAVTAMPPVVTSDQTQKVKSQPNNLDQSPGPLGSKPSPEAHTENNVNAVAKPLTLDDWQTSLSAAMRSPLWGENAGMQKANQALLNAQMAGQLNDLRDRVEAQRGQSPTDVIPGRMLAAVEEFGGSSQAALEERRRIVTLDGSEGEDWFALAQSEERAGNSAAAKAAYGRALTSPVPPPPFHAAIARQRSQ